mgnify:CR=1 FL=1
MEKVSQLDYLLLRSTLARLLLWLFSIVLLLVMAGTLMINAQRVTFEKNANKAIYHVHEQLLVNDAALSGFGSLLNSVGPNNLHQTRDFTTRMRAAYPHIYMFEALVSVDPANKAQHETQMQELGYEDYKLTRYVSETNSKDNIINMIDGVPMHFPIFFIDPYFDSLNGLMGFDMMSARTMREPLLASLASGEPTASKPYKLREGGRGYVLIKALDTFATKGSAYSEGGLAALVLIKTDTMLASAAEIVPVARVSLLYGKDRTLAAEDIAPQIALLPVITTDIFIAERDFDDLGQPFTLSIQQSAGLYPQHLQIMGLIFILLCLAYGVYYVSLIAKYRLKLQRDTAWKELGKEHSHLEVMVAERTKELQRKSDENTSLAQQLIRVQEDQYLYIARELHDEFGQILTAIKINSHILESAENIHEVAAYAQDITSQADGLYETMRNMIQRLRPEALDMFGLKVAVDQCVLAFHLDEQEIELDLNIEDSVNDLEEAYTIASYRIVQELVNNTVKHSKLTRLEVRLYVSDQQMHIIVKDNGIGFDPLKQRFGFGLSGVDERARSLGGTVDINTVIDEGVTVYVRIPLQAS